MRELSLFTGAGGGILGSKLLGWKTLGYVEWGEYCQKIIAQRIRDGIYDRAPIFTDVREFAQSGAARAYRGHIDVVSGGFPCQPFSVAGKRKASDDDRNMWPATMDVIKAVKPPVVFLENVPGLLSATVDDESGRPVHYFGTILRDLAESGYNTKWCVLGADDVGAPHHRKRLWILAVSRSQRAWLEKNRSGRQAGKKAYTLQSAILRQEDRSSCSKGINSNGRDGLHAHAKRHGSLAGEVKRVDHNHARTCQKRTQRSIQSKGVDSPSFMANSTSQRCRKAWNGVRRSEKWFARSSSQMAYTIVTRLERNKCGAKAARYTGLCGGAGPNKIKNICYATKPRFQNRAKKSLGRPQTKSESKRSNWWSVEPELGRVANGVASRTNRLKSIGNGQVPLTMAAAYAILSAESYQ